MRTSTVSALARDRGIKRQMYAHAGIPTYWIANLVEHCIEVYTDPSAAGAEPAYRRRHDYGPLDTIPFVLDGAEVGGLSVSELLP